MSVWSMNSVWVSSGQSVFSLVPPVSSIIVYQHGCHGSFIIGQIGFKWNKIWDLFSTFQYILARRAKMYWEWSLKSQICLGTTSNLIWHNLGPPRHPYMSTCLPAVSSQLVLVHSDCHSGTSLIFCYATLWEGNAG